MKITHLDNRTFSMNVRPCVEKTVEEFQEFDEEIIGASTPARADLFCIDESKPLADEKRRKLFHKLAHRMIFPPLEDEKICKLLFPSYKKDI